MPTALVLPDEILRTAAALEEHDPAFVVAKSMGTHAAPPVADPGEAHVTVTRAIRAFLG